MPMTIHQDIDRRGWQRSEDFPNEVLGPICPTSLSRSEGKGTCIRATLLPALTYPIFQDGGMPSQARPDRRL